MLISGFFRNTADNIKVREAYTTVFNGIAGFRSSIRLGEGP